VFISVRDNGEGIDSKRLEKLGKEAVPSLEGTGSALENLNKRLISLFGESAKLHFVSSPNGTTVYCTVPYQERQG
jgi:two-component system sensor histidine kinase LytS